MVALRAVFEMRWVDRINEAILRRMARGHVPLAAIEHGIARGDTRYLYAELERAVAYCHPNIVGDDWGVLLDFGSERVLGVSQHDEAWGAVTRALDVHPRSRMSRAEWSGRLAAEPTAQLELLAAP